MITSVKKYKTLLLAFFLSLSLYTAQSQTVPGFTPTGIFDEQELTISNQWKDVIININAPLQLKQKNAKTNLVFFALPNGNSIEWTKGKKMLVGDDWHFDIQHIAAQTRYVRQLDKKNNYIIVYAMAAKKSWPAWKRSIPDSIFIIKNIVDSISRMFKNYQPEIILNGHSGGGSLIFGYLDAVENIPPQVKRIAFLDSDYGYEEKHAVKFAGWLKNNNDTKLFVLAYNDSLVIYNGKPLVSPTGGTWYRSRLMQRNLSATFDFSTVADTAFIRHSALNKRIQIILKENPKGLIYHTEQVARNGFILSLLSATKFDRKKHFTYFGERVYQKFISD